MKMTRWSVFLGCLLSVPIMAGAWQDEVDTFVASLKTPAMQRSLGLKDVRRPDGIVNRLDVVFEESISPEARGEALQELSRTLFRIVFEKDRLPSATVIERDAQGRFLNQAVTSFAASSVSELPRCQLASRAVE